MAASGNASDHGLPRGTWSLLSWRPVAVHAVMAGPSLCLKVARLIQNPAAFRANGCIQSSRSPYLDSLTSAVTRNPESDHGNAVGTRHTRHVGWRSSAEYLPPCASLRTSDHVEACTTRGTVNILRTGSPAPHRRSEALATRVGACATRASVAYRQNLTLGWRPWLRKVICSIQT